MIRQLLISLTCVAALSIAGGCQATETGFDCVDCGSIMCAADISVGVYRGATVSSTASHSTIRLDKLVAGTDTNRIGEQVVVQMDWLPAEGDIVLVTPNASGWGIPVTTDGQVSCGVPKAGIMTMDEFTPLLGTDQCAIQVTKVRPCDDTPTSGDDQVLN